MARTPAELANELAETFQSSDSCSAAIDRHVERVDWLRDHVGELLEWLELDREDPEQWTVDGTVVLEIERILDDSPLPVVTFRDLERELEAEDELR